MASRSSFTNRMGFVLATAGAAVGLGNIWRFPYLASEYGGGIFLLTYLILVFTAGFVLVLTESALGRMTGSGVLCAYEKISKKLSFAGYLTFFTPLLIFSFYSVVGGWVMYYALQFIIGNGSLLADSAYFSEFTAEPVIPAVFTLVFIAITAWIVLRGVRKGIEKTTRLLMPVLLVMLVVLSIYCICMPGGLDGLWYFIYPDFSQFSAELVLAALGQMFFTLMIGSGVIMTYGSYLSRKENLVKSAHAIDFFDTAVAILAGLLVIPAVFALSGGSPEALGSGPALMFIALPHVFETFPLGGLIGAAFFLMVFFAAITSSVSMYEVAVASLTEKFSISRKKAVLGITAGVSFAAVIVSLGFGVLDFVQLNGMNILDMLDFLGNSILLPVCSLFACFAAGWILKPKAVVDEICSCGVMFRGQQVFSFALRYLVPAAILIILITGIF